MLNTSSVRFGEICASFVAESHYYGYYGCIQPDIGRSGLDGLLALFSVDQCPYADFHYWPGYLSDAGIEKSGTDIRFIVRIYRTYRFLY